MNIEKKFCFLINNMCCKVGMLIWCVMITGLNPVALTDVQSTKNESVELNATAGELLLELMIRITTNSDQWDKIHHFLESIKFTENLVELQHPATKKEPNLASKVTSAPVVTQKQRSENSGKAEELNIIGRWPAFQNWVNQYKVYSKGFAYERVTGRPIYLGSDPKAYVAVSVVAPKHNSEVENDLLLEKQLSQLKPWTHQQNLKNMASIRSKWVIRKNNFGNNNALER